MQKLAYHTKSLTKLQSATRSGEQTAGYTNIQPKTNNRQANRRRETISLFGSSSSRSSPRLKGGGVKIIAVNGTGAVSLINSTVAVVNTESTNVLDSVSNCTMCLAQSHRASRCQLVSTQLRIKVIHRNKENLKTQSRCTLSYYRPKYARSSPSLHNQQSSPTAAKQS